MATVTTTLSAAVTATAREIKVASATSVTADYFLLIDDEWMRVAKSYVSGTTVPVIRGLLGSAQSAHPTGANVTHGKASDFDDAPAQAVTIQPYQPIKRILSYKAAGAITLPKIGEDMFAVLIGTDVLAMTIADPGEELDGCELTVLSNGTAAHTLTVASGLGGEGSSYNVLTLNGSGPVCFKFVACGGYWHLYAATAITGTVTNITAAIS